MASVFSGSTSSVVTSSGLPHFTVTVSETPSRDEDHVTSPAASHSTIIQDNIHSSTDVDDIHSELTDTSSAATTEIVPGVEGSLSTRPPATSTEISSAVTSTRLPAASSEISAVTSAGSSAGSSSISKTVQRSTFSEPSSVHSSVTDSTNIDDVTTTVVPSGGLSQGAIIGIAVGVSLVVVILVVVIVIFVLRMKRNNKRSRYMSEDNINEYKLEISSNKKHNKNGFHKKRLSKKPSSGPYFQHDPEPEVEEPQYSPDGMPNNSFTLDLDTAVQETEIDHDNPIIRNRNMEQPVNRAILAESRYSLGPLVLGDVDGYNEGISTSTAYSKVYSTDTFK